MVHWPTVCASEVRQGFQDRSRGMKGSQESLTTAVVKDAANWPTPRTNDDAAGRPNDGIARVGPSGQRYGINLSDKVLHGQAAPASSNSLGSRQGLWPTARGLDGQLSESLDTWEARRARKEAQGINLHRPLPIAVEQEQRKQWATPRNCGGPDFAKTTRPTSTSNSPSLPTQVAMQGWITPKASDGKSPGISRDIHLNHQAGGKLNPRWVETLMGLPIGWTMPSCTSPQTIAPMSCDSSAMELCQPPQSELSEFSLAS
jgi:hypothetical protein